jgi:branched-chain amino acid transport system permease protein
VTYNTMFMTSRVMSFTAGQLGMVGGVLGSLFALRLGLPVPLALAATLACAALIGVITEFVAVRPVLKSLDQHL